MSTPSMLVVPKWDASASVIMPSLQPMSRHFLFWNQGFSMICIESIRLNHCLATCTMSKESS